MPGSENDFRLFAAELRTDLPELDLHGRRAGDVTYATDTFLDQQFMTGATEVRIIFGKGTGKVREVVVAMLSRHELVDAWREAASGGSAVIILAPRE